MSAVQPARASPLYQCPVCGLHLAEADKADHHLDCGQASTPCAERGCARSPLGLCAWRRCELHCTERCGWDCELAAHRRSATGKPRGIRAPAIRPIVPEDAPELARRVEPDGPLARVRSAEWLGRAFDRPAEPELLPITPEILAEMERGDAAAATARARDEHEKREAQERQLQEWRERKPAAAIERSPAPSAPEETAMKTEKETKRCATCDTKLRSSSTHDVCLTCRKKDQASGGCADCGKRLRKDSPGVAERRCALCHAKAHPGTGAVVKSIAPARTAAKTAAVSTSALASLSEVELLDRLQATQQELINRRAEALASERLAKIRAALEAA